MGDEQCRWKIEVVYAFMQLSLSRVIPRREPCKDTPSVPLVGVFRGGVSKTEMDLATVKGSSCVKSSSEDMSVECQRLARHICYCQCLCR